mmetsp:Transcript_15184/g.57270  ORF Transcript_15184/g.57270 Transcript_15184/m.57270 type:complete len:230 (-) Transcript_15184:3163-3852(-)
MAPRTVATCRCKKMATRLRCRVASVSCCPNSLLIAPTALTTASTAGVARTRGNTSSRGGASTFSSSALHSLSGRPDAAACARACWSCHDAIWIAASCCRTSPSTAACSPGSRATDCPGWEPAAGSGAPDAPAGAPEAGAATACEPRCGVLPRDDEPARLPLCFDCDCFPLRLPGVAAPADEGDAAPPRAAAAAPGLASGAPPAAAAAAAAALEPPFGRPRFLGTAAAAS